MIIEKEVEVKIGNINMSHYRDKGYDCKMRDIIKIPIEDIYEGSHIIIHAQCENEECLIIKPMSYEVYMRNINSTEIHKYYCNKCNHIKVKMIADIKQQKGTLTRSDQYYWTYSENIEKELLIYIDKYNKNLNNMKDLDYPLFNAIHQYKNGIMNYLKELNLNPEEYFSIRIPQHNYTKEDIINKIKLFIEEYNRFPFQQEMTSLLKINTLHFNKYFKNYNECKKEIGYYNVDDLVDNRGDINRSFYELYTANYLIAQGLGDKYSREEFPFKEFDNSLNYRSDFTFYPQNIDKVIHVEVWGDNDKNNSRGIYKNYLNTRKEKERLYKKYSDKIILISIEPSIFTFSYKNIEKKLYNIFKDYITLEFKTIDYELLLSNKSLTEIDIFNLLMKYTPDKNRLPIRNEICCHKGGYNLCSHIDKRFGGLTYFADKYNLDISHKNNFWNNDKVFECFDYMINTYGKFYSSAQYRKEKDIKLKGFYSFIGGKETDYKLKYFEYLIDNNKLLNDYLFQYLVDISNKQLRYVYNITDIQQQKAKQLLLKYKNKYIFNLNNTITKEVIPK